jgi:hypothetical protein
MRYLKKTALTLALAGLSAIAFSALAAGSASASALCLNATSSPCNALVANGTVVKGSQIGSGTLTASSGVKITCTGSLFEDEITENPNAAGVVLDELKLLTFSGCKESTFGSSCTATVSTSPALMTLLFWSKAGTTGPNGTIIIHGIKATVVCPTLGVTCKYEGAGTGGSVTGNLYNANDTNKPKVSTHSEIDFNAVELTSLSGGAICGTGKAKETTTYEATTSGGADVFIVEK